MVARSLAQEFGGDLKAADWRHFRRLAAFSNQKERHRQPSGLFPYVRLVEATGDIYPKAATFISATQERFEAEEKERRERLATSVSIPHVRTPLKSIDQFRANPLYGGDGTRSDLAFALSLYFEDYRKRRSRRPFVHATCLTRATSGGKKPMWSAPCAKHSNSVVLLDDCSVNAARTAYY